jgi:hypothetical protein
MIDVEKACFLGELSKFLVEVPDIKNRHSDIKFIHLLEDGTHLLIATISDP